MNATVIINTVYKYYVLIKEPEMQKYKKLKGGNNLVDAERFFNIKKNKLINNGKNPNYIYNNAIQFQDGTLLTIAKSNSDGVLNGYDVEEINFNNRYTHNKFQKIAWSLNYNESNEEKKEEKKIKKIKRVKI